MYVYKDLPSKRFMDIIYLSIIRVCCKKQSLIFSGNKINTVSLRRGRIIFSFDRKSIIQDKIHETTSIHQQPAARTPDQGDWSPPPISKERFAASSSK